jgi:hypothetical protein
MGKGAAGAAPFPILVHPLCVRDTAPMRNRYFCAA